MGIIVREKPMYDRPTPIDFSNGTTIAASNQILVWVSLNKHTKSDLPNESPYFPAVINTGFTGTFLIQDRQLNSWAGMPSTNLVRISKVKGYGRELSVHAAKLWVRPNVAGKSNIQDGSKAVPIELYPGIIISPSNIDQPRLPLIGIRALAIANLQIRFRWKKNVFSLGTTPWWQNIFA